MSFHWGWVKGVKQMYEKVMGYKIELYLSLDEIENLSLIIIFIIIRYLFNHVCYDLS